MEEDAEEIKEHLPTPTEYLADQQGVPNFWAVCLKNNRMLQQIVRERDSALLEKTKNVTIHETNDKNKK
jgi:hypothetical protein